MLRVDSNAAKNQRHMAKHTRRTATAAVLQFGDGSIFIDKDLLTMLQLHLIPE